MTDTLSPIATASLHAQFAGRCGELGVPCWCVNTAMTVTASPETRQGAAILTDVISIAHAATNIGLATRNTSASFDLFAMSDEYGVVVVDLFTAEPSSAGRDRLAHILTHYHNDLSRAATDTMSINGFAEQLSQSYEEVNLIFRMAKLLTSSGDPQQVVQTMCDELRSTLNYGWLSMVFDNGDSVLAPLRGVALHAGKLPWDGVQLARDIAASDLAAVGRVVTKAAHPLAAKAGSELLAERVMQAGLPIGTLVAGARQGDDPDVTSSELQLVQAAAGFLGLFHQNAFRFAEQRQQFLGTLNALSAAVDAKDPYTHGHSDRVGLLGAQLAARIGMDASTVDAIRVAGLLHDIGKIGVPEAVLRKPARLTDEEFTLIKQHPEIGYGILKDLPSLAFHLPGVLHHHERYDGRGYPHGLAGEQIPLIARILALADTFDAMSSNRAYRAAMDRSRVLEEIRKSSGVQFDPALVEPFVTLDFSEFDAMLKADRDKAAPAEQTPAPAASPATPATKAA